MGVQYKHLMLWLPGNLRVFIEFRISLLSLHSGGHANLIAPLCLRLVEGLVGLVNQGFGGQWGWGTVLARPKLRVTRELLK